MKKTGFTFVELIITSTILIILSTLGFYSYSKYVSSSRDSERKSNLLTINSGMNLYKQKRGSFPLPGNIFLLTNGGIEVVKQGKLNEKVSLSTLDIIPLDPYAHIPYIYSITQNKQEFQIGATLENNNKPIAFIEGNYKTVSKNILPSIMIAYNGSGNIDITGTFYKNKFIINQSNHNLPYNLENGVPFNDGSLFIEVINDVNTKIQQNGDYKTCNEIYESGKNIGNGEYQILNESGSLNNIDCIFP